MPRRINSETGRGYLYKDRVGQKHGRLTFVEVVGVSKHKQLLWRFLCDCGNQVIRPYLSSTRSCGCLRREVAADTQRSKAQFTPEERKERAKANAARQRARRKTDPAKAMQARLSRLHRWALVRVGAIKKSPTFESLGYSVDEFVCHIERQFLPGMGWHNMSDWQIDHIIPTSGAKTEKDVWALNQLPNLRPIWAADNNAKKDKRTNLL